MTCWEACAPLHLSIVWVPFHAPDPYETGSLGAGLLLEPCVRVRVCSGMTGVEGPLPPAARKCLEALGWSGERVEVELPYPLGYGLGVSGSTALAACLAYASLKNLSCLRAADEAHAAEVLEETGLGDVTAIYTAWGLEVRVKPGAPGRGGLAEPHSIAPYRVYAVPLEAGETRLEIMEAERHRRHALEAYELVRSETSLLSLRRAAESFTSRVTPPPPEAERVMKMAAGYALLVVYKKGSLVAVAKPGAEEKLAAILARLGRVYELRVSNERPRVRLVEGGEKPSGGSHDTGKIA